MIRFTETIMSLRENLLKFAKWLSNTLKDISTWLEEQAAKLDELINGGGDDNNA